MIIEPTRTKIKPGQTRNSLEENRNMNLRSAFALAFGLAIAGVSHAATGDAAAERIQLGAQLIDLFAEEFHVEATAEV